MIVSSNIDLTLTLRKSNIKYVNLKLQVEFL